MESRKKHIPENSKPADFETAITASGYGKFNIILYILAAIAGWSSVFETTTMSYVFPAAECDLDLNLSDKGILNAVTYTGMISSGIIWGYLCDTFGRKKLLSYGFLLDALFVIISATSQSFIQLAIAKFFGGVIINGPFSALTSYLSEFHGTKYRARVQMALGTFFGMGNLILPILAFAILPLDINFKIGIFEFHTWNLYLFVCACPALLGFMGFMFLPESPKFLMSSGRNDKALEVFKKVYKMNTGKSEDTYPITALIVEHHCSSDNSNDVVENSVKRSNGTKLRQSLKQIKQLFLPPYLSKILLIVSIQFMLMMGVFSVNTLRLWLPQIYQSINDYEYVNTNKTASLCDMLESLRHKNKTFNGDTSTCEVNFDNIQVYTNSMIVATTTILGYITAGTLINVVGKKTLLGVLGLLSGLTVMTMYLSRSIIITIAQSAVFITLGSVSVSVILAVVVDLLPTTFRTVAIALTMIFGRLGASIGNLVFPVLLEAECAAPFFLIGSVMIICAFVSCFIPNTEMKALL